VPLIKGTNSYVDVSEADAYFSTRLGSGAWAAADESDKEAALVTATMLLDQIEWLGIPISYSQPLAFPRSIPDVYETTPTRFLFAVYEQALHLINNPELMDETGGVESLTVGPISLTNIKNARLIPLAVERYISLYTLSSGGLGVAGAWWRAN
jgi:hypothetical protein